MVVFSFLRTHTRTNDNPQPNAHDTTQQVIKARLQQRETGQQRWRYAGTWDCISKVGWFGGEVEWSGLLFLKKKFC